MKLNLLVSTSQINSREGRLFGTGTINGLRHLANLMVKYGFKGDLYDLPNSSRNETIASPFSINSGFALTTDELNLFDIPELHQDQDLLTQLQKIQATNEKIFQESRTVSYTLKRSLMPWVLERCHEQFLGISQAERLESYAQFLEISAYWLEDYAVFCVLKEMDLLLSYSGSMDLTQKDLREFKDKYKQQIDRYKYTQFLCFEQRLALHRDLQKLGIGLIVNLPFGVEFDSADVYFHPAVFGTDFQVGCSPEPEHGYPEQAWGVAVYKERTEALRGYLLKKMEWIRQFGDGVFLDHLVGWCGQYVVPVVIPEDSHYPYGHFLTEVMEERKENLAWFLDIVHSTGLKIRGEVAGDSNRVLATNAAIASFRKQGKAISAMAIPRWESDGGRLKPLNTYREDMLMMVETHDTSTLLQYLINRKGYQDDFESAERILCFCHRVLGLPFLLDDVPLDLEGCSDDFWFEVCRRLCEGTPSRNIVFTLPGLLSILCEDFRTPTIENNINVKPGTSGKVGNGWRNWSYFSPPLEIVEEDKALQTALKKLGQRRYQPFDYFHRMETEELQEMNLEVFYSVPANKRLIYRDKKGRWQVLSQQAALATVLIDVEILVSNNGYNEIWHRLELGGMLALEPDQYYQFQDLNGERGCYRYSGQELMADHLFIKLQPGQRHHFWVYRCPVSMSVADLE